MKKEVELLIVTHLPVFYKVNLYNELAKTRKLHVIYIANQTQMKRSDDFLTLGYCNHSFSLINEELLEKRNVFASLFKLLYECRKFLFVELLVSGWELPEFQVLIHINQTNKNSLALESTANEGKHYGWRAFLKRTFLKRITKVYASGNKQLELLDIYGYQGERVVTKGVGLINYENFNNERIIVANPVIYDFLYIGRLSEEKNILQLIDTIKKIESVRLTICGTGPLLSLVKSLLSDKIRYRGIVNNNELTKELNSSHCLILPSLMEPWGLVVEEALYSNVPVIVSKNSGVSVLIENGVNGALFDAYNDLALENVINEFIINFDLIGFSTGAIGKKLILSKDKEQVQSYAKN